MVLYQNAVGMAPEAIAAYWGVELERVGRILCPAPPERPETLTGYFALRDGHLTLFMAYANRMAATIARVYGRSDLAARFDRAAGQLDARRQALNEELDALLKAHKGHLPCLDELPEEVYPYNDALAALAWPWACWRQRWIDRDRGLAEIPA
jgi:hypothetical protein